MDDPSEPNDYPHENYSNGKRDYDTRDYSTRDYDYAYNDLPERSFSTDTEYAWKRLNHLNYLVKRVSDALRDIRNVWEETKIKFSLYNKIKNWEKRSR